MGKAWRVLAVVMAVVVGVAGLGMWSHRPAEGAAPYYDASAKEGSVYRLYRAYFLREPDEGGFLYWYRKASTGTPLDRISASFANSSEFKRRYGSLDDDAFVQQLYRNVFNRQADSGGLAYWLRRMHAGLGRGGVVRFFSDSSEYRRTTAAGVPPAFRAGSNALVLLNRLAVAEEPERVGYDDALFPHWDDADHDGCDTRCEVLASERRSTNTWFSWWDGLSFSRTSDLDIDHVVALAEAWDSGASTWDAERRDAFADWTVNLVAVGSSINESKSDRDAGEWSPPRTQSKCLFAEITVTTKFDWGLSVDPVERSALATMLDGCTRTSSDPPGTPSTTRPPTTRPPTTHPPTTHPPTTHPPTTHPPTTHPPTTRPGCSTTGIYRAHNGACIGDYEDATGDVDCGQLPAATKPVFVLNPDNDPYGLDGRDHDGIGCESG